MFPLVADLRGRRVVVIGAGRVGAQKVAQLRAGGARVSVITNAVTSELGEVESLTLRPYQPGDLAGAFLVVSATGDPEVNDRIVEEANDARVLLNVVDDPGRSNFFFTAVHRDGDVVVSVSTEGASPALAQWVRNRIAAALPTNLAGVATRLRAERHAVHASGASTEGIVWTTRVQELIDDEPASAR